MNVLYHGGAPGFRSGDIITPHPTKHVDGCEWCASGADDNHLPDRVFATPVRLYAKHFASKYIRGWLYIVEEVEGSALEPSDNDPFESYHAEKLRVVKVCERSVELTMSERRHLHRDWAAADAEKGIAVSPLVDMQLRQMLGFKR